MSSQQEKDPLDGLGDQEEHFYKLDQVVFAEALNAKESEEKDISDHNEFTFMDKITVEKRSGRRNKYHIEIDPDTTPRCPQSSCNREFSSLCLLRSHIRRVHCSEHSYVCEQCGARFTAKYLLDRHAGTHGEKVECPICLKMLSKRTSLSVHMRSHSNIRAHKCLTCGKCFVRKCTLNVHMRVHRDLKCAKCERRTKDGDGIKSGMIVSEVQKRPCLYDTNHMNYGDRAEKMRSWEEVCESVVPCWSTLGLTEKFAAGKEVQKRWRSIRDSYTKAFRQGKCPPPEQCAPGSRRYQYHRQMSFLLRALQNKKPRYSQDKYESFSEVSNSPQHPPPEDIPRIKHEIIDKPLDLKTKPDIQDKPETQEKYSQATIDKKRETKIDGNSILPEDHFDDDKLFMNSLLPLFKKMDDDTRLLCRIEVLKLIRYALQGHKCFEALKLAEDSFFRTRMTGILAKEDIDNVNKNENTLSMTTRSADGSRPIRKRRARSPSPLPVPPKRRGPGRPRKIRPPPSDSDEEQLSRRRFPKLKVSPIEVSLDEDYNKATSVAQLSTPLFMKMYNLERSKVAENNSSQSVLVSVKTEPLDTQPSSPI